MTIRVSPLKKHAAGDGESPFIQKICRRCWTRFGPSGPQGSRVRSNTACGGTTVNIAGSCSVLNRCVTSSATSSDGTQRILILRTSSGQKRSCGKTNAKSAGLPMRYPTPLSSSSRTGLRSTRIRPCSTIAASRWKTWSHPIFAHGCSIPKISSGCGRSGRRPFHAGCRLKSNNAHGGRMASTVGSSSVTTRSATNRGVSCAGMPREPTSTIAS